MLRLESDNLEDLYKELLEKKYEVSVETVKTVIRGIDANVDKVNMGVISDVGLILSVDRHNYLNVLKQHLPILEEAENYELCSDVLEYINKLSN